MKKYILIILLISVVSCSDWLDVSPQAERKKDDMFKTEAGFKSALTGAYIGAATSSMYGRNMTILFPESFMRHWVVSIDEPQSEAFLILNYRIQHGRYQDTDVENMITLTWEKYYNTILSINNVLDNIGKTEASFTFNNQRLIEGEALGFRAFLHFDLLRFFGPVPTTATNENCIPYVETVTKSPVELLSLPYNTVLKKIITDLNRAEELLADIDPILNHTMSDLRSETFVAPPDDDWQLNRQIRFNYYAVLATKARYYLWTGDKEKAATYAKMVIDAVEEDGEKKFPLATESYLAQATALTEQHLLTLPIEHIFALHNSTHYSGVVRPMIEATSASNALLRKDILEVEYIFEKAVNPDDIRNKANRFWKEHQYQMVSTANIFLKYGGPDEETSPKGLIPAIRISEMYLIMMECSKFETAQEYFEEYRIARTMNVVMRDEFTADKVMERVEREYRKEFYGEGQYYHFCKRHNITEFDWPNYWTTVSANYVLPKPLSQINFE